MAKMFWRAGKAFGSVCSVKNRAALIIIPAATAKRLARNLTGMLLIAVVLAVVSTVAGSWMAFRLHRETGPLIVIVATCIFLLSFVRR
jgi:ABC-type Mn2+/Zn2+ transport system permease subunit